MSVKLITKSVGLELKLNCFILWIWSLPKNLKLKLDSNKKISRKLFCCEDVRLWVYFDWKILYKISGGKCEHTFRWMHCVSTNLIKPNWLPSIITFWEFTSPPFIYIDFWHKIFFKSSYKPLCLSGFLWVMATEHTKVENGIGNRNERKKHWNIRPN